MRLFRFLPLSLAVILIPSIGIPFEDGPDYDPDKIFIRLTLYPTASLSRYDYNNDIDLYEIRPYVELRAGSASGQIIRDARVTVSGKTMEFKDGQYIARIPVDKAALPTDFAVRIDVPGRAGLERTFPIPAWLILKEPRPAVFDPEQNLVVKWMSAGESGPVNLRSYDFKTGQARLDLDDITGGAAVVPGDRIPPSTIIRVFVIQAWIFKRFIEDPVAARGSELNIIPWSQVFIRTK